MEASQSPPSDDKPRATKADLERELAKLHKLKAAAEIDWQRKLKSEAAIQTRRKQIASGGAMAAMWELMPAPQPYDIDEKLHKDLHAQHYVVADLEREIAVDAVDTHPVVAQMMRDLGQKLTRAGS